MRYTGSDDFVAYVLGQLQDLEHIQCRAMFGGHGLYHENAFFGIVHKGRLYFRTTDKTRPSYESAGMQAFRPNEKQTLHGYYEVPAAVLTDPRQAIEWALDAIDAV